KKLNYMVLNPYLNFNGRAEEAFRFYHTVFGGEFSVHKMGDAPGAEDLTARERDYALHVSISIGNGQYLMASDCVSSRGQVLVQGNNNYISITPDSREEAMRIFSALSSGGQIEMPLEDMFWGDYFGSFRNKFGVYWMINYANSPS